ncbi:MAG: cobalt-precorrin-5B (C(1))-methyltransferase, partial [Symploca sp. SIO2E6]|nr:cobalt-precorrin-5B (C(1))-methyltransferase [Symploca sp. SIO2E6]
VSIDLIKPPETVTIPIEQVAGIREGMALAVTRSQPGDNLDLTRHTPIWALVEWAQPEQKEQVKLIGGEGIGRQLSASGKAAIYAYAEQLLQTNLQHRLAPAEKIQVTIILPEGRLLAQRTSNEAFGVVAGLSLLGTTGISQPLSAPGQLESYREELQLKASKLAQYSEKPGLLPEKQRNMSISPQQTGFLVFCVGENGLDIAQRMGINPELLVKTANWLGPLLVTAGLEQVPAILLFGYHGKLMKLAGGIFHTHHHLADGRLEILTAHCAQLGLPTAELREVFASSTAEAALQYLRQLDASHGSNWVEQVYSAIASTIDRRSQDYIRKHSQQEVEVGSVLFNRNRQIIVTSQMGATLLSQVC